MIRTSMSLLAGDDRSIAHLGQCRDQVVAAWRDMPWGKRWRCRASLVTAPREYRRWLELIATYPIIQAHVRRNPSLVLRPLRTYVCRRWRARQRVERLRSHFVTLACLLPPELGWSLASGDPLQLLSMVRYERQYDVTLEAVPQRTREGDLHVVLRQDGLILYRAAITLDAYGIYVSCLQGAAGLSTQDRIRQATRDCAGVRPKSLLMHVLRTLCAVWHLPHLWGISNRDHPLKHRKSAVYHDYDATWQAMGGTRVDGSWYELPLQRTSKELALVPSRKRAAVRSREQMYERIAVAVSDVLGLSHGAGADLGP